MPFREVCYWSFLLRIIQMLFVMIDFNFNKTSLNNQFTHLYIKTWKVLYRMQFVEGNIFCCVRVYRRKCTSFAIFTSDVFFLFSTSYFSSERDPGIVKILSHILKSIFHQKLVKVVSSDKRQLYLVYIFIMSDDNWF